MNPYVLGFLQERFPDITLIIDAALEGPYMRCELWKWV